MKIGTGVLVCNGISIALGDVALRPEIRHGTHICDLPYHCTDYSHNAVQSNGDTVASPTMGGGKHLIEG